MSKFHLPHTTYDGISLYTNSIFCGYLCFKWLQHFVYANIQEGTNTRNQNEIYIRIHMGGPRT